MRIPPEYVNAPAMLVYGELPRTIAMTGIRIWGLGWIHRYEQTDPIPEQELMEICRVSRSQLYEHLGRLVATGVLRYTNTGGEFTFFFDRPTRRIRDGPSPENRTDVTLLVVVDSSPDLWDAERSKILEEREQQQQVVSSLEGGEWGGSGGESGKPDWAARAAVLDRIKVLEPTRSEILALPWATVEYLEAWEDWWVEEFWSESFNSSGIGLVIEQIRAGIEAPATRTRRRLERYADVYGEWW